MPFVGREQDLETVGRSFQEATQGKGSVVFITGEAGIGKTTFINAFKARHVDARSLKFSQTMDIIRHPITPEKAKAWHWKSHQYFTKQAHNVVREYVLHFTKEGDTVLDFTAGSFTTGVACVNLNRKFIGIELDRCYFDIGVNRIKERINCLGLKIEPEISMGG